MVHFGHDPFFDAIALRQARDQYRTFSFFDLNLNSRMEPLMETHGHGWGVTWGVIPSFPNKVKTKDAKSAKEDKAYLLQIFASFALFVVTSLRSF